MNHKATSMKFFFVALSLFCMLIIVSAFAYSTLKNKQHKDLCDKFYKQFGYVPNEITLFRSGGMLFTFQKDLYFLLPLIFKEGSFFVRNINKDYYTFVHGLSKKETSWIKIKFSLLIIGLLLVIPDYMFFIYFIKQ